VLLRSPSGALMFFSRSKSKHSVRQFPQWLEVCLQLLPELFGQVAVMLSLREANIGLPTYALDAACLTWLHRDSPPQTLNQGTGSFVPSEKRAPQCAGFRGGGKRRSFRRHQFGARQWDRDDRHKWPQTKVPKMELH